MINAGFKKKVKDGAKKSILYTANKRSSRTAGPKSLPKTAKLNSRKSRNSLKHKGKVNDKISLTDLQFIAKSRGITFGGLSKTKLIRKINTYY